MKNNILNLTKNNFLILIILLIILIVINRNTETFSSSLIKITVYMSLIILTYNIYSNNIILGLVLYFYLLLTLVDRIKNDFFYKQA